MVYIEANMAELRTIKWYLVGIRGANGRIRRVKDRTGQEYKVERMKDSSLYQSRAHAWRSTCKVCDR